MYGKNLTQRNQTQARRWGWSRSNYASRRFKQPSLSLTISASDKTSLRPSNAIQHLQQWSAACFIPIYERKARVDVCRPTSQSKSGVDREIINRANSTGIIAKQSKLVWLNLVGSRQHQRVRGYRKQLASWFLCKVAKNSLVRVAD